MPIEQLLNKPINARDFQPVEEEGRSVKGLFEELKGTPLYNKKQGQWYHDLYRANLKGDSIKNSEDQLLAVLVEGLYDKQAARRKYETLKKSGFYDLQNNRWNEHRKGHIDQKQQIHSRDQLLGILIEGMFDKEKAKRKYEKLKKSRLYDKERKQWNNYIKRNNEGVSTMRTSESQLLGILAEGMFDKEAAQSQYENLKQTPLYKKNGVWQDYMKQDQTEVDGLNYRHNQLLGFLVEALFDKETAKKRYENQGSYPLIIYNDSSKGKLMEIFTEGMLIKGMVKEQTFSEKIQVPEIRIF